MVLTYEYQTRSTFSGASLARSAFQVRGYEPKSSVGANWAGLTKIEPITLLGRGFACRTSETWPSWSAPMVGTSAVVLFFALMLSRARRNAGTVRTIIGLRDIWTRSVWSRRRRLLTLRRGFRPYQNPHLVAKTATHSLKHTAKFSNDRLALSLAPRLP